MQLMSYGYLTMTESGRGPVNICLGPGEKLHPEKSRLCKFSVAQGLLPVTQSTCISQYLYPVCFPRPSSALSSLLRPSILHTRFSTGIFYRRMHTFSTSPLLWINTRQPVHLSRRKNTLRFTLGEGSN